MFCRQCGKPLINGSNFCSSCGTPTDNITQEPKNFYVPSQYSQQQTSYSVYPSLQGHSLQCVANIVNKLQISGIAWIIVASLQVILAFYQIIFVAEIGSYYQNNYWIINGVIVIGMGIWNLVCGIKRIQMSNSFPQRPVGIVGTFEPISGIISVLIANILLGGIIGIIGSIFDLTLRNYVMSNRVLLYNIEKEFYENDKKRHPYSHD